MTPQETPAVVDADGNQRDLVEAAARRTDDVVAALSTLDDGALLAPSALPGWSRLTIACHLRYGAPAFRRMTLGAIEDVPVAYYPAGRERERPATLEPGEHESPAAVMASLAHESARLHGLWDGLTDDQWQLDAREPDDNPDLGTLRLARLPLLRLTEVEVHGSDLGVGLDDWSSVFVETALPSRLHWLETRRTNHRPFDGRLEGSWLLVATDGPSYLVTVMGSAAECRPADPSSPARAVIEATSRDLLALLLGRPLARPPHHAGDVDFARAFTRAFPGP